MTDLEEEVLDWLKGIFNKAVHSRLFWVFIGAYISASYASAQFVNHLHGVELVKFYIAEVVASVLIGYMAFVFSMRILNYLNVHVPAAYRALLNLIPVGLGALWAAAIGSLNIFSLSSIEDFLIALFGAIFFVAWYYSWLYHIQISSEKEPQLSVYEAVIAHFGKKAETLEGQILKVIKIAGFIIPPIGALYSLYENFGGLVDEVDHEAERRAFIVVSATAGGMFGPIVSGASGLPMILSVLFTAIPVLLFIPFCKSLIHEFFS